MTRADLLAFMRRHTLAVQTSVSDSGAPQAAVVGIAVMDDFEIVFDSEDYTRKVRNLRQNPRTALIIGGLRHADERTIQYEGDVDEPSGAELDRLKESYFATFPEGRARESWPGLVYLRVRPTWVRYSDYNQEPPEIVELDRDQLAALR